MSLKLLITGSTGFVGSALARAAIVRGLHVRAGVRRPPVRSIVGADYVQLNDFSDRNAYIQALAGIDVVVHCAARVHVMNDTAPDILAAFRLVNVEGTLALARYAEAAGVKRFVFVSSVKVNGESTHAGRPFRETDVAAPQDPYGISKHEAEEGLRRLAATTGMDVTIIRPPLVYGPGVKANFAALMNAIERNFPLPLGAVRNQRSLVSLDNLVDLILLCLDHPQASNQTFLVSDDQDLSIADLVRAMARATCKQVRLIPVPVWLLQASARLVGKRAAIQRMCGNLQVDISKAKEQLGWTPLISVDEGLRRVIEENEK